ncbi:hypothetical protein M404DRAFT_999040 [Pisolithus tinctorius Marx 270]|uniref:Uncharacterized protein n=1 Tax=Pisolithus tinctorius Marx 270 TaxID=870435 RepID=A0A0C3JBE0_PISTI|nr:hypothetical protein M404DRAFT_999040 [Pisolithus tinctorius Marx 270]
MSGINNSKSLASGDDSEKDAEIWELSETTVAKERYHISSAKCRWAVKRNMFFRRLKERVSPRRDTCPGKI